VAADPVDALRAQLAASVRHQVSRYAANLATVVQSNPHGSILTLLNRPDVAQSLDRNLAGARAQALAAVQQSWQAGSSPTLSSLIQDVERAYNEAPGRIRQAAITAWHSIPQQSFTVGVSTPGTNPAYQTAYQRAQAVRTALEGQADALALRNGLSTHVAAAGSRTEVIREEAGIPAGAQFPHPAPIGKHQPPKLYRGVLHGPPLHPNCRCELQQIAGGVRWVASMDGKDPRSCAWCRALHGQELLAAPQDQPAPVPPPQPEELPEMVSSEDIAALPEERYQSLRHFLVSALHELAQLIRELLGIGGA
jgi:hypothetical protein